MSDYEHLSYEQRGPVTVIGVYDNVLKIKPPMLFQRNHVDLYCEALDRVLD